MVKKTIKKKKVWAEYSKMGHYTILPKKSGITKFFETHKKGSFHSQLGVRHGETIPMSLLEKIKDAHEGEVIYNPYYVSRSKKFIKVTPLMIKKAKFLYNIRR